MNIVLYFKPTRKKSDAVKIDGVRGIATRLGWHLQIVEAEPNAKTIDGLIDFWHPIGAIAESDGWNSDIRPSAFKGLKTVFIDPESGKLPPGAFAVGQDSYQTGLEAGRELLLTGRENFAYIPFPRNTTWSAERLSGFEAALETNGKTYRVFHSRHRDGDSPLYRRELQKFICSLPRPAAIFAANDETAETVLTTATVAGFKVPEDFAVLGVDNFEQICENTTPSLSSVEPDFRRCGELAALMLAAIIRDDKGYRGDHLRTFGPLRIARRASTRVGSNQIDSEVSAALELIRREACNGLKAEQVMATFGCSRPLAAARFKKATGHTILNEIHAVRLERAKSLLMDPNQMLKTISDFCGFDNPNSLRKFFRREMGMTMSEWREKNRNR